MTPRVLLADDSPRVRQSVRAMLERQGFEVVGEAADGQEAVRLAQALEPDVAVLDVSMPPSNGLTAAVQIRDACRSTGVILLTVHSDLHQVLRAVGAGIRGYVVKSEASEDLARAIWEVSRGGIFYSPKAASAVIGASLLTSSCPLRSKAAVEIEGLARSSPPRPDPRSSPDRLP